MTRCTVYDCDGSPRALAVVEVVQRFKPHGEPEEVSVNRYCTFCLHLSGHDDHKARKRPHAYPGHYRRRRCTWLTTTVNGEVPA